MVRIEISALPQINANIPNLLKDLNIKVAMAYGCNPKEVISTWNTLNSNYYAVGDRLEKAQPVNSHPPIIKLFCVNEKEIDIIESLFETIKQVMNEHLELKENIAIDYNGQVTNDFCNENT